MTLGTPQPWTVNRPVVGYQWRRPGNENIVLLQHGFAEYARRFETRHQQLIPQLVGAGFDVYAIDMRGHGNSPGRRGLLDVKDAVHDHLAARRALPSTDGFTFVYGHSLGGLVAAASVAEDATGVDGAIISSAALPARIAPPVHALLRLLSALTPTAPAPTPPADASGLSQLPEEVRIALHDPQMYQGRLSNRTAETSLSTANRLRKAVPRWSLPTLVLHGTEDTFTDPAGSQQFFDTLASTDKQLVLVEGGRHELLNDADGPKALATILAWLRDRTPDRSPRTRGLQ